MFWVLCSVLFWGFFFVSSVVMFPIAVMVWATTSPFDRRGAALHLLTNFWGSLYTWFNPLWSVTISGREHIRRGQAYVMVANHLSMVDVFVLHRLFVHFKWVSKIENFRLPFIGWNMSLNRYIGLKRGDRQSVVRMMEASEKALSGGSSVMMFPEGTRSKTGRLRPFKTGAFDLALRSRCPILPIVIDGSSEALPKKGVVTRGYHPIRVTVLAELPYESFADVPVEELTERVRNLFLEHRPGEPIERERERERSRSS